MAKVTNQLIIASSQDVKSGGIQQMPMTLKATDHQEIKTIHHWCQILAHCQIPQAIQNSM